MARLSGSPQASATGHTRDPGVGTFHQTVLFRMTHRLQSGAGRATAKSIHWAPDCLTGRTRVAVPERTFRVTVAFRGDPLGPGFVRTQSAATEGSAAGVWGVVDDGYPPTPAPRGSSTTTAVGPERNAAQAS